MILLQRFLEGVIKTLDLKKQSVIKDEVSDKDLFISKNDFKTKAFFFFSKSFSQIENFFKFTKNSAF